MDSGIVTVPSPSFRDREFDPSLCADSLEFVAFALKEAVSLGDPIPPELLADLLDASAGLLRYAHAWAVGQSESHQTIGGQPSDAFQTSARSAR